MARKDGSGVPQVAQLVKELRAAGFKAQKIGTKWLIAGPKGGTYTLPAKLTHGSMYDNAISALRRMGFERDQAAIAEEKDRLQRLARDRAKGDKAMAEAVERAAAAPAFVEPVVPAPPAVEPYDAEKVRRQLASIPRGTEVVMMTAEHALELLLANRWYDPETQEEGYTRSNRKFHEPTADKYARWMVAGQWHDHHQGIGIDREGQLADGQHRLVAVVKADEQKPGIKVPMQITYGLPVDAADVVDQGMRRGVAGVLSTHREKNTTNLAAATKMIMFYDQQKSVAEWSSFNPSATELMDAMREFPEVREFVESARGFGAVCIPSAVAAASLVTARHAPVARHEEFFQMLRTGLGVYEGHPVYVVREALLKQRDNARRKRNSLEQFAMIIKAWNAWAEGRKTRQVAWRNTEAVPRAIHVG